MIDMTKAEILDVWKGFVRNMTDQGAVVPFAHEIASRVRNELLDSLEAAEKSDAESLAMYRKARDERDALRAMLMVALDVLEDVKGNINPERGYADELEADVECAIAAIHGAKGECNDFVLRL